MCSSTCESSTTFRMKLQYSIFVIMLLHSNTRLVYGEEVVTRIYSIDDEVFRCSRLLSNIIYNFCENTYKIAKRDTASILIEKMAPEHLKVETNKQWLSAAVKSRVRRQLADECCNQACTVADVITYCPIDAKLIRERPDIFELL